MIEEKNGKLYCIGYAQFLRNLKGEKEPLFLKLQADVNRLSENGTASYLRLIKIQHALIDILNHFDPNCVRFPEERRSYVNYLRPGAES